MITLLALLGLQCPEHVWPEMRFRSCRCTRLRWHRGTHYDRSGDAWEGKRR